MYLLDTNVLSETRKGHGHALVKAWVTAQPTGGLYLSAITVLEVQRGIYKAEQQGDQAKAAIFERWLEERLLPAFAGRILTTDQAVARRAARLPWPDPRDYRDALIAATALVHGAVVVTRNVKHFEGFGVKLLNPWEQLAPGDAPD
jgi:predicted nucleic acid-binding protein